VKNKTKQDKIITKRRRISVVLNDMLAGKYAIPRLQREFVWDGQRAAKLMDSIYKEMPIGTSLIWDTTKSKKLYLRQQYNVLPHFNDKNKRTWFLIDGQQRMSVLHGIHQGKPIKNSKGKEINFRNIVFSLEKKKKSPDGKEIEQRILYRKPQQGRFVSLSDILSPQFNHHFNGLKKSSLSALNECRKRIMNYKIVFISTRMSDIDEVKECFLRINTLGMKVSSADAIFTRAQTLDLRDFVHEVRNCIDNFKDIDEMPILWAMTAIRGECYPGKNRIDAAVNKIEEKAQKKNHVKKELNKEWSLLKECFRKSAVYLENEFRVLSANYLYSPYMLSMLALFHYFNNKKSPNQKQKKQIRRWFWVTTTARNYSGQLFYKSIQYDSGFFRRLAKNDNARFPLSTDADFRDILSTPYDKTKSGMGASFYSLLFKKKPVSLLDDALNEIQLERYLTPVNKDRHHIFPRSLLKKIGIRQTEYNSICNICLLTAEENQSIGNKHPSKYLKEAKRNKNLFGKKMSHHLIPSFDNNQGLWAKNTKKGFHKFIKERQILIKESLEKEAGIRLFRVDK
jgi:hypothetical protein